MNYRLNLEPHPDYLHSPTNQLSDLSYRVKVWVNRERHGEYIEHICNPVLFVDHSAGINLPVEQFTSGGLDYAVYIQAAVVFEGVVSEYRYFFRENVTGEDACRIPVELGEWGCSDKFSCDEKYTVNSL